MADGAPHKVKMHLNDVFGAGEFRNEYYAQQTVKRLNEYEKAAKNYFKSKYQIDPWFHDPVDDHYHGDAVEHPWWTGRHESARKNYWDGVKGLEPDEGNIRVPWEELRPLLDVYRKDQAGADYDRMVDLAGLLEGHQWVYVSDLGDNAEQYKSWVDADAWDSPDGEAAQFVRDFHMPQIVKATERYLEIMDAYRAILNVTAGVINHARGTALRLIDDAIERFKAEEAVDQKRADEFAKDSLKALGAAGGGATAGSVGGPIGAATGALGGLISGEVGAITAYAFAPAGDKPEDIHKSLKGKLEHLKRDVEGKKATALTKAVTALTDGALLGSEREKGLPLGTNRK